MKSRFFLLSLTTLLPALAFGQDFRCSQGGLERRVSIVYETGVAVPCEVHYYKDSEAPGERQVLWTANNESGYCETKTQEFIEKLEGWGWSCESGSAAGPEPAAVGTDDTAVLSAGDESEVQ